MIKRLNENTLVEFTKTTTGKPAWNIICTERARRQIKLSSLQLSKIKRWEHEYLNPNEL